MKISSPPTVSIILPVYNSQKFLQQCLNSIFAQIYSDFEVVAIDDCSNDSSSSILKNNAQQHKNLFVITEKINRGQGHARNMAIKKAQGKYILFVDSDDILEPNLLLSVVPVANKFNSDLVWFNWKPLDPTTSAGALHALNHETFAGKAHLVGSECERYLNKKNYFVWDALYRRAFLLHNKIKFGEGYIYEDVEFVVQCASYAQRISIFDQPLYIMRHNTDSTSRSRHDTPRHYLDFIKAAEKAFIALEPRTPYANFYLGAYLLEKFTIYYRERVPWRYHSAFLHDFINLMRPIKIVLPSGEKNKFFRTCINANIFAGKRYKLFHLILLHKTITLPARDKIKKFMSKIHHL